MIEWVNSVEKVKRGATLYLDTQVYILYAVMTGRAIRQPQKESEFSHRHLKDGRAVVDRRGIGAEQHTL